MGTRVIQNKNRLSLNLFDAIVLMIALAVGGFLLWQMLAPEEGASAKSGVIEYTISIKEVQEGTSDLVVVGSEIYDVVKNYHLGTVISSTSSPAQKQVLNHSTKSYQTSYLEGYEDIEVRLTTTMTESDTDILADAGFEMRVGTLLYMRGAGYMAVGYITQINRTDGQTPIAFDFPSQHTASLPEEQENQEGDDINWEDQDDFWNDTMEIPAEESTDTQEEDPS